jgi:hypothetical protein
MTNKKNPSTIPPINVQPEISKWYLNNAMTVRTAFPAAIVTQLTNPLRITTRHSPRDSIESSSRPFAL